MPCETPSRTSCHTYRRRRWWCAARMISIVPQRWAEEATGLLPRGQLVVLEGAIHTITYTRPDQLVEAILPFLQETTKEDYRSSADVSE